MPELLIRKAQAAELPAIVALLADDHLGQGREDPSLPLDRRYQEAFWAITANPDQQLVVALEQGRVVGALQLTVVRGLSRRGAARGLIEAVRIAADRRGQGLGERLVRWAMEECRRRGCANVQLTTDRSRADAHRFYERLGFKPSHLGYKLDLGG